MSGHVAGLAWLWPCPTCPLPKDPGGWPLGRGGCLPGSAQPQSACGLAAQGGVSGPTTQGSRTWPFARV